MPSLVTSLYQEGKINIYEMDAVYIKKRTYSHTHNLQVIYLQDLRFYAYSMTSLLQVNQLCIQRIFF